jgi:hypothetical protein
MDNIGAALAGASILAGVIGAFGLFVLGLSYLILLLM